VILWRNMAIYLKPEAAASVWRGLASALSPEGVLVVGKAEQPLAELALVSVGRHIYRSGCAAGRDTRRSGPRPTSHGAQRTPETVA
jgi:chemotaxis methyl-accepting protein methylase